MRTAKQNKKDIDDHMQGKHKKRPPRKHCVLCQQEKHDFALWLKEHAAKLNNQSGSIIPELCWLVATLLLAMLFIVPTVRHYDAQITTLIEKGVTPSASANFRP